MFLSACGTPGQVAGLPAERPDRLDPAAGPIAIVGDLQMTPLPIRMLLGREGNKRPQRLLIDDIAERRADLSALVISGDLVFAGWSRPDWRHFDSIIGPLAADLPVIPVMGNHDYRCILVKFCSQEKVPGPVVARFPWLVAGEPSWMPYGNVALVFLDSETAQEAQGRWLRERLAQLESSFDAVVLFTHRPPYTENAALDVYPDPQVQAHFVSALADTSLTSVFFSGHAHGYEHMVVDDVHYIVTAGGGGPRSRLLAQRPADVYPGENCAVRNSGEVLRPYNYALLQTSETALTVTIRGFCRGDSELRQLETFTVDLRRR